MGAPLEELERDWRVPGVMRRAGGAFHLALARAAHNPLLAALTEPVMALMDRARADLPIPGGPTERGARDHRRIYDAIAARDGDRAAAAMEDHLSYFESLLDRAAPGWRGLPVHGRP